MFSGRARRKRKRGSLVWWDSCKSVDVEGMWCGGGTEVCCEVFLCCGVWRAVVECGGLWCSVAGCGEVWRG